MKDTSLSAFGKLAQPVLAVCNEQRSIINRTRGANKQQTTKCLDFKIDSKSNSVTRDKVGHYIIKEPVHQKHVTIINICTQHQRAYT